jgi:opacity protein-like surface antigen
MYGRSVWFTAALLAVAIPASAQYTGYEERKVNFNIGGGFTIPYSDSRDVFSTGGNFQIGATVNVTPMIAFQANYGYTRFGSKDIAPTLTPTPVGLSTSIPLSVNHSMHDGDFNVLVSTNKAKYRAAPYGIAGLGVYHSIVNLTTPSVGIGTVCDPWLLICYPTPVAVDQIIGERTSTDFGINFGGGLSVHITGPASFFAEVRYIHTYGPTINNAAGQSVKANGNYWPFIFGFRL